MAESDVSGFLCDMSDVSDTSYQSDAEYFPNSKNYDISNGSPIDNSYFNIVHYNINSITAEGRIDELTYISKLLNVGVFVFTESKLDTTIPTNLIQIDGFHDPVRRDRQTNGRDGGGTLIYVSQSLAFKQRVNLQSENFEHLWVDVIINNKIFVINALYRPPNAENHELFLDTSEQILISLNSYVADNIFITSDLNFGNLYCKELKLSPKPLDSTAPDLFQSYGFNQLIDIPTRITDSTISLIDLFFVFSEDDVIEHGTFPKIADHEGLLVCLNTKREKIKQTTKTFYDYENMKTEELKEFIKNYDFQHIINSDPICQPLKLTDLLVESLDKFLPTRTVTIRNNGPPWANSFTRLLLRKKNRNYRIFKQIDYEYNKVKDDPQIKSDIKTKLLNKKEKIQKQSRVAANNSLKINRRVKEGYYNTINSTMSNNSISAKKKFNILIKLMNNKKYSHIPPLLENGKIIDDSKQKSDILNKYFASKSKVDEPEDEPPNLIPKKVNQPINTINKSPLEVAKIIRELKKSYMSHCGLPAKFLTEIATPISFVLSKVLNNLFEAGMFPEIWKISHITAIHKRCGLKCEKYN